MVPADNAATTPTVTFGLYSYRVPRYVSMCVQYAHGRGRLVDALSRTHLSLTRYNWCLNGFSTLRD